MTSMTMNEGTWLRSEASRTVFLSWDLDSESLNAFLRMEP
jgi:hypothetical protein